MIQIIYVMCQYFNLCLFPGIKYKLEPLYIIKLKQWGQSFIQPAAIKLLLKLKKFFSMFKTLALLQLAFLAMAQNSPGSLNECGEVNNVNDSAGENWDYKFHCPSGYQCVNKVCRNGAGNVVKSVVDRCSTTTNQCEENINLTAKCGLAITRRDKRTYYFNCGGGADVQCLWQTSQCIARSSYYGIITSCNYPGLYVMGGQCLNECPADLKCEQIVP